MFNRRYLRYKVLEAIYAFLFSRNNNLQNGENFLFQSIDKVQDLYFSLINFTLRYHKFYLEMLEEAKRKHFPTEEDLNPNPRFINNRLIAALSEHPMCIKKFEELALNWNDELDTFRKIYLKLKEDKTFLKYMTNPDDNWKNDKEIVVYIFDNYFQNDEYIKSLFEENTIFWVNDLDFATKAVKKTFREFNEEAGKYHEFPPLYKDEKEDKEFITWLFRKTILRYNENTKIIVSKAENWDTKRIAKMDILIMNMAIIEFTDFPSIPVKVTINEYLELAKKYSTPKSNIFINGILDKIAAELKSQGKIVKKGRGLLDK